jgi:hypothetical protein
MPSLLHLTLKVTYLSGNIREPSFDLVKFATLGECTTQTFTRHV